MNELTSKKYENIIIRNEIMIDGILVKTQQCSLDLTKPNDMDLTDWTSNKELYKNNREAIRIEEARFEDECYERQNVVLNEK